MSSELARLGLAVGSSLLAGAALVKWTHGSRAADSTNGAGAAVRGEAAGASRAEPDLKERWVRSLERSNHLARRRMEQERESGARIIPWDHNWDRRDPQFMVKHISDDSPSQAALEERHEKVKKAQPKVTRRLVLIRHGQYTYNSSGNDEDHKLTELGHEQARLTGLRLKEYLGFVRKELTDKDGNPLPIKLRLINSTMRRARETKEQILAGLDQDEIDEILSDDLIREGAPIPPEPPISAKQWSVKEHDFFQEGGRIEAGFRRYFHRADPQSEKEEVDVIVCHGNVIRYFVCRALQLPPDAWLRISLAHTSLTALYIRPSGRVGIAMMGESGHLPPEKVTFS